MIRYRNIYSCHPNGLDTNIEGIVNNVYLEIAGLFDTYKLHWTYYVISTVKINGKTRLTDDISPLLSNNFSIENIEKRGKKFECRQDAESFINEFKIKWETGSNNTTQELRDQKIKEITDEK